MKKIFAWLGLFLTVPLVLFSLLTSYVVPQTGTPILIQNQDIGAGGPPRFFFARGAADSNPNLRRGENILAVALTALGTDGNWYKIGTTQRVADGAIMPTTLRVGQVLESGGPVHQLPLASDREIADPRSVQTVGLFVGCQQNEPCSAQGLRGLLGEAVDGHRVLVTDQRVILSTAPMLWNAPAQAWYRHRGNSQGVPYVMKADSVQLGTRWISESVSAANTAVSITLTGAVNEQNTLYKISGRCSAGTAQLTVSLGATQVWSTAPGEVGTTNRTETWNPGLSSGYNQSIVVTLTACGAGNTGTLSVQGTRVPGGA